MTTFRLSTYFQGMPLPQQMMARFELSGWLTQQGETGLAKAVCNAATPEGLAPHLAKADTLLKDIAPETIFRSARFFAPQASENISTSTSPTLDDKVMQLANLAAEIRKDNPKRTKTEGARLATAIEKALVADRSSDEFVPKVEGYLLEGQGYLLGARGDALETETPACLISASAEQDDPWIYGARLFIDAMRSEHINAGGPLNSEHQWRTGCVGSAPHQEQCARIHGEGGQVLGTCTGHAPCHRD